MGAVVLAQGARGALVETLQTGLGARGFLVALDGDYGTQTASAVSGFQRSNGLQETGEVDPLEWNAITGSQPPSLLERSLQLTASFEGHGFTLAQGNFDGAGITWGIVGFTLQSGEIQGIVRDALASDPSLVDTAFGTDAAKLRALIARPFAEQLFWADQHSEGPGKATLAEPWRTHFRDFGNQPAVQALQLSRVQADYFQPALKTAAAYALNTELGIALCFDIHVQNGGIRPAARQAIAAKRTARMSEPDLRVLIAESVADAARAGYRQDVRDRKLAIADGQGRVHGRDYRLRSWGLDESSATS